MRPADLKFLETAHFGDNGFSLHWEGELKELKQLTLTISENSDSISHESPFGLGPQEFTTPLEGTKASCLGFDISQCPNLEVAVLYGDPSLRLVRNIAKAKHIRSIAIHTNFFGRNSEKRNQEISDAVTVLPLEFSTPPPAFFQNHHDAVRNKVLTEYGLLHNDRSEDK